MGKRGPARTPQRILEARGSWLAKERAGSPEPIAGMPECPDWLTGEGRAEWDRQVQDLWARKLIAKTYRPALAMFCEAWGEYVDAVKWIEENGPTYESKMGTSLHPMVTIKAKAFERAYKLGQQFGFSPASQSSLSGSDNQEESDGKSRFFAS